jgi:hypothetical protein
MSPAGTDEIIAKYLGDVARSGDLIAWAVEALVDGHDSRSLRDLAGLDLDGAANTVRGVEAGRLFHNALRELGIAIPRKEEALRAHLKAIATLIVAGKISPCEGLGRIEGEVQIPLGYPSDLKVWYYLVEDLLYPNFDEVRPDDRDRLIVREARTALADTPLA